MGTALLRGRDFTEAGRLDSVRVAIVNGKMAADFWPGTDPVGKRFRFYGDDFFHEVVGVAETSKYVTIERGPDTNGFHPPAAELLRRHDSPCPNRRRPRASPRRREAGPPRNRPARSRRQ